MSVVNKSNEVAFEFLNGKRIEFVGVAINGVGTQVGDASLGTGSETQQMALEDPSQQHFSFEFSLEQSHNESSSFVLQWYQLLRNSHSLGLYRSQERGSYFQMRAKAFVSVSVGEAHFVYELQGVFPLAWKLKSLKTEKIPRIALEFSYEEMELKQ